MYNIVEDGDMVFIEDSNGGIVGSARMLEKSKAAYRQARNEARREAEETIGYKLALVDKTCYVLAI